jgi:uncharacterized membrane protein YgdD (TMEM256/DUF423 family)
MKNWIMVVAGLGGAAAVVAGAVGSHALALDPASREGRSYELAVFYLLVHSVALLALALHRRSARPEGLSLRLAAVLFTCGMILFSGSLIVSTLLDLPSVKALAPYGGMSMIAGWLAVASATCWHAAGAD